MILNLDLKGVLQNLRLLAKNLAVSFLLALIVAGKAYPKGLTPTAIVDACPVNYVYDPQTKYCLDKTGTLLAGSFPVELAEECSRVFKVASCKTKQWPKEHLLYLKDTFEWKNLSLSQVLKRIEDNPEVYGVLNEQDLEGHGIFDNLNNWNQISEQIVPPYILSPRRQTDSLVRQMLTMLPQEIKNETAFVIADRLIQHPSQHLSYLKNKKQIFIVGSFLGVGNISQPNDPELLVVRARHERELFKLKATLALAKASKLKVAGVLYSLGDSNSAIGETVKADLQKRFDRILLSNHLKPQLISWGADELVPIAFANSLPKQKVFLKISNPASVHFYDGLMKSRELAQQKLNEMGLLEVQNPEAADFSIYVFTRRPSGSIYEYEPNDLLQEKLDIDFLKEVEIAKQKRKVVIVDARIFNGAWNSKILPKTCDYLAYGSWGTFSNNFGATVSLAKILNYTKSYNAAQKFYLEAAFHDVFFNGYEPRDGGIQKILEPLNIQFSHFEGYKDLQTTAEVFSVMNNYANEHMREHFAGTQCLKNRSLRATPQFWRTFEAEVHVVPAIPNAPNDAGIHRLDLPSEQFDPNYKPI
jgi:hypothetical protein